MSPSATAPPPDAEGGGLFFLRANFVFVTSVATAAFALLINIVLFRQLGADGKGQYSLFVLTTTIGSGLTTLGVGLANVYFIGRQRYPLGVLIAGSEFLVGAVTLIAVSAVAALAVSGLADPLVGDLPLWLFAVSIPLTLQVAQLAPLLQARQQFGALNLAAGLIPGGTLAGVAVLAVFDALTVERALFMWVASYGIAVVIAVAAIGGRYFADAFPFRPDFAILRDQVKFGLQGELGNLLQLANYRFDLFMVAAFRNAAAVGFYSVAVALAESLWLVSSAVLVVLTPRLTSAGDDEAAEFAPFVCRTVLLINGVLAVAIAVVSPLLIEVVFGAEAERAVTPMFALLPGVVALSGSMVLSSYIFSRGRPILNTYSNATTVVVTLALDLVLIPEWGIDGAAIASTIAYTTTLALSLVWYRRLSGRSPWNAILPRSSDARVYAAIARQASVRVRHAVARGA